MSETTPPAPSGLSSFLDKHHFLLRRLHSLSGIIPVGLFVCFHLFTNMQMMFSTFQHEVEFIHNMPALIWIEIFGLWLPIAFHAGLGVVYTFTGRANSLSYGYADNWRYTLQRITGILALIFIFLHIATLRWRWDIFGWYTPFFVHGSMGPGQPIVPLAYVSTAAAIQTSFLVLLLYVVGVLSVVYHWANGLWTAAISWGLTVSVGAQRRWGVVCILMFVGLLSFGAIAIQAAVGYTKPTAQQVQENPDLAEQRTEWLVYEKMVEGYREGKVNAYGQWKDEHGRIIKPAGDSGAHGH